VWVITDNKDETSEIPCCDVKKTSTGSMRTLAASLVLLNCPEPAPPPAVAKPPVPQPQYDLSHRLKDPRLTKTWSGCAVNSKSEPCASRADMLIRFNKAYDAGGVPDLRRNYRTGKKHQFAANIHSQVLRGSTIAAN